MEHYEVAIIGAGMSGLAAGIRLAHFGKKVCIFERHYAPGGLNSFYSKDGRKFDVGLHAMTNFVKPGVKGTPLGKILRQLRISREELDLSEQKRSRIAFTDANLSFSNDFSLLESEVARVFPKEVGGFRKLSDEISSYPDAKLDEAYVSARSVVRNWISDPLLEDMIFCPLMYYGSATEDDMDFSQFVVMFRSIFLEGFARPLDGIRKMIRLLLDRYRSAGGIRRMRTGISRIETEGNRVSRLVLDSGEEVEADVVLSSAGLSETFRLIDSELDRDYASKEGQLSFTETISIFDKQPSEFGWGDDAIVFFNHGTKFEYQRSADPVDLRSGVICIPNNFDYGDRTLAEGVVRVTCLANYDQWTQYEEDQYIEAKEEWNDRIWKSAVQFMPKSGLNYDSDRVAWDMFTPKTVERYTWHARGAIYGSPSKLKDGKTAYSNLFLCGTDQGYLGIIGSMLSGIAMANQHVLRG